MERENFTAVRVAGFECETGKKQVIFRDAKTPGLGLRVTATGAKSYIFETKLNNKTIRLTIGDPRNWPIGKAQAEASRLKVMTDQGIDPRKVLTDRIAAQKKEVEIIKSKEARETITVSDAWKVYITERSASIVNGKPEWGDIHKAHHAYFVAAGGVKRKRGVRPNEPSTTRPGMLYPLLSMRLVDLDENVIASWLEKESAQAPTSAAKAYRFLRAFLTWCSKKKEYSSIVHANACLADSVIKKVQKDKPKENDSLRRAQIKPWFEAVHKIGNPVISSYLQGLLLTGARRNELAALRWQDVDFQWKSLTIHDKVEGERTIPLTPYLEHLISSLPRRNEFVFSSPTAKSGRIEEPRIQHVRALKVAGLPMLTLHGLRRSFGTLSEWVEVPAGIVAQIMGHKPSAIAEKHYIQRELDLLHMWHVKIESWILNEAGIQFVPVKAGLQIVA